MIVWITGISGSGKTTIANFLLNKLKKKYSNLVNLDGDVIRNLFGDDLGYDVNSRIAQIKRIQKLCSFLESQDLTVIVAALYSSESLLNWNRKNFQNYLEIYLDANIDLVKKRDPKNIYKKYYMGKEKNIVGIDIEWNEPSKPDIRIKMNDSTSLEEIGNLIYNRILNTLSGYN